MAILVQGEIVLPSGTPQFSGASLYVSLEETGLLDMPAQVLSAFSQHNLSYHGQPVTFTLEGEAPETGGTYRVSAEIILDGGRDLRKGDFVTKRIYNVLRHGHPDTVKLEVERV